MTIQNAIISAAKITTGDHGFLDCWLTLDYGDGIFQGFGGWALYLPKPSKYYNIMSLAGHHIFRIMKITGVENWTNVVGKSIRVRGSGEILSFKIEAIGHIINDDWYCPTDDFAKSLK